jgi:membrane protease YdiL (CAAX protease family)
VNQRLPLSYMLALGWTLGAAACLSWLLHLSVVLRPSAATDVVQLGAVEALVFVLGVLGVLALHGSDVPLSASLGLRPTHPGLVILGLALGLAAHWPVEAVDVLSSRLFPEAPGELAAEAALLAASSPLRLVVVLLVIACAGPFVEELFFRGALFGALRRRHPLFGAAAITAVCFVVGHLNVRRWPALAVVAIVLSLLRGWSGSLLPSLAMHVVFNAATVLAFFTGQAAITEPRAIERVPTFAGAAVTLALLIAVQYVASRAKVARRGRAEDAQ